MAQFENPAWADFFYNAGRGFVGINGRLAPESAVSRQSHVINQAAGHVPHQGLGGWLVPVGY
jgi:hypothetical protein